MIRIEKNSKNPYTMINNNLLHDEHLSWKAKGILAYLLSLPDDWKVYESELVKHSSDGIDSLRSGITELIENGYIDRTRFRNEKGHLKGYTYSIHEVSTKSGLSKVGLSKNGKTKNGLSKVGESNTTNTNLTNTNLTNTNNTNKELQEGDSSCCPSLKDVNNNDFKEIAQLYQTCIGQPNGFTVDWIEDHLKDYGFEWLKNALLIAEEQGKRKKSYVNAILNNWKTEGGMKLGGSTNGNGKFGHSITGSNSEVKESKYAHLTELSDRDRRELEEWIDPSLTDTDIM